MADINFSGNKYWWIINAIDHKTINGIKIPAKLEVSWRLEEGVWTWLKLEITDIRYNVSEKHSSAQ